MPRASAEGLAEGVMVVVAMEVLRVDLRPRVASELRALRDAGAIPAGATLRALLDGEEA